MFRPPILLPKPEVYPSLIYTHKLGKSDDDWRLMNFVNLWKILVEKLRIEYRLSNSGNRNELRNEWTGSPYDLEKEQVGWGIRLWLWLWLVVGHTSSSGASASKNNEKKTLHHKFFWGVHQGQTRCFLGGGREELDCRRVLFNLPRLIYEPPSGKCSFLQKPIAPNTFKIT